MILLLYVFCSAAIVYGVFSALFWMLQGIEEAQYVFIGDSGRKSLRKGAAHLAFTVMVFCFLYLFTS